MPSGRAAAIDSNLPTFLEVNLEVILMGAGLICVAVGVVMLAPKRVSLRRPNPVPARALIAAGICLLLAAIATEVLTP